jgi:hypothetical protein
MTEVIRHIESEIGASHRVVDLLVEHMVDVVKQRTVPTFSLWYPHLTTLVIDENEDRVDPVLTGRYYVKTDWVVLGIAKMVTDSLSRGIVGGYPLYGIFNDPFDRQINADVRSMVEEPMTWRWVPPNVLEINQKWIYGSNLTLELKVRHAPDLHTVPETMRDEFLNLATADVKTALYNIRAQFTSINSPFGSIELNIDDLKEGKQERTDLLEKWRTNFAKQANRRKIWPA